MHPDQAQRIRDTWALAVPEADAVATTFYRVLFERAPHAAQLFAAVDMAAQRKKFLETVAALIAVLDDPHHFVREAVPSGRRHHGYGVEAHDYALAGEALLVALAHHLGDRFDHDTREAWRELYALLAAVMQRAGAPATST